MPRKSPLPKNWALAWRFLPTPFGKFLHNWGIPLYKSGHFGPSEPKPRAMQLFSAVHFVEKSFVVEFFEPTIIDDLFRLNRRGFGILFGDVFDDDLESL
jgi:hypothetical protein